MTPEQFALLKKQNNDFLGYIVIMCLIISGLLIYVFDGIAHFIAQALVIAFAVYVDSKTDRNLRDLTRLNSKRPDAD